MRDTTDEDGFEKDKLEDLLNSCREEPSTTPAPAGLRSRIYSAMIRQAKESGPLKPLSESVEAGHPICLWEDAMRHLPTGESANHCTLCPARVIAETFDGLSMPWSGCPYRKLHTR